jgi:hypothetical protein
MINYLCILFLVAIAILESNERRKKMYRSLSFQKKNSLSLSISFKYIYF